MQLRQWPRNETNGREISAKESGTSAVRSMSVSAKQQSSVHQCVNPQTYGKMMVSDVSVQLKLGMQSDISRVAESGAVHRASQSKRWR